MRKAGLFFILFILSSTVLFSQEKKQEAPIVRLGNLDTSNITCETLLKNAKLIPLDGRWAVTRFMIAFTLPDGKTYGPFPAEGSVLPEAAIKVIKRLKKKKAEIFIHQINVVRDGKEKFTLPIILRYNN